MIIEVIIITLIISFFIYIFYLVWAEFKLEQIKETAKFIEKLEENDFRFKNKNEIEIVKAASKRNLNAMLFTKSSNFTVYKSSVKILCRSGSRPRGQQSSEPLMIFNITYPINPNFHLAISKRGFLSKFLGINKGDLLGVSSEYNIRSSNLLIVKSIINNSKYFKTLEELVFETIDPILINKSKFSIVIIHTDADSFMKKVNAIIEFKMILQSILDQFKVESHTDISLDSPYAAELKIFTIEELTFLSPICIICYQDLISDISNLKDTTEAFYLLCCGSFVHFSHLTTWLTKNESCPYCQFKDPGAELVEIKNLQ